MRIALCHENVLPAKGGAEMYVADLARRLSAAGHEIHLYSARWDDTALPANAVLHRLASPHGPRFLRPWRFSESVISALDRDKPEVSIGFDKVLGTDVYYPLGGLHVATAEHNLMKHRSGATRNLASIIQQMDAANNSFAILERRLLTGPRRPIFVANSDLVRQHARRYYGLDPTMVPVIHNAIDPSRFSEADRPFLRAQMRQDWGFQSHEVVAALVAMNYRLKGLEPLLRAVKSIPDEVPLRLLIAGSRKTGPWERLARWLGVADRVRFIGRSAEIRRVFFAADLLVHPTFYDPCSLVVLEALACGLPVITTKNNGAGERISPPAEGFVIDNPHNYQELANCLMKLADSEQRQSCSRSARQAAQKWTFNDHVIAMEQVLEQAAGRTLRATA